MYSVPMKTQKRALKFDDASLYLLRMSEIPRNKVPRSMENVQIIEYCTELKERMRAMQLPYPPYIVFKILDGLRKYWSWRVTKDQAEVRAMQSRCRTDRRNYLNEYMSWSDQRDEHQLGRDKERGRGRGRGSIRKSGEGDGSGTSGSSPPDSPPSLPDNEDDYEEDGRLRHTVADRADILLPEAPSLPPLQDIPVRDFLEQLTHMRHPEEWLFDRTFQDPNAMDDYLPDESDALQQREPTMEDWTMAPTPLTKDAVRTETPAPPPVLDPTLDQTQTPVPAPDVTAQDRQPPQPSIVRPDTESASPQSHLPEVSMPPLSPPPLTAPEIRAPEDDDVPTPPTAVSVRRPPKIDRVIEKTTEQQRQAEARILNVVIPTWDQIFENLERFIASVDPPPPPAMPGNQMCYPDEFGYNEEFREVMRFKGPPIASDIDEDSEDSGPSIDRGYRDLTDPSLQPVPDDSDPSIRPQPDMQQDFDMEPDVWDSFPDFSPNGTSNLRPQPTTGTGGPLPVIPEDSEVGIQVREMQDPLPHELATSTPFVSPRPPDESGKSPARTPPAISPPAAAPAAAPSSPSPGPPSGPPSISSSSSDRSFRTLTRSDPRDSFVWEGCDCLTAGVRKIKDLFAQRDRGEIDGVAYQMLLEPTMRRGQVAMFFRVLLYLNDSGCIMIRQQVANGPIQIEPFNGFALSGLITPN